MTKEDLIKYKEKLGKLSEKEEKLRNLYLSDIAKGNIQGPSLEYASVSKPWLSCFEGLDLLRDCDELNMLDYMKNQITNLSSIALNYFDRQISFRELFSNIEEAKRKYAKYGYKKGDTVSICSVALPETIYSIYALNSMGITINMIDPRVSSESLEHYVKDSNSKGLIIVEPLASLAINLKSKLNLSGITVISPLDSLPTLKKTIKRVTTKKNKNIEKNDDFDLYSKIEPLTTEQFEILSKKEEMGKENVGDKTAVIVYTGGTTGVPKGVCLTNDNFNHMAFQYKYSNFGVKSGHKFLDIITPSFAYGICNSIHLPLSLGMQVVIVPVFDPKKFATYITKYKINHTLGVPRYWLEFIEDKKVKNEDLSYLLSAGCGGDVTLEEDELKINEFLKSHNSKSLLAKGYGMTELSSAVVVCNKKANKVGSVGVPMIEGNMCVIDEEGNELPYGAIGEICLQSTTIMKEYYNNQDETNNLIKVHEDGKKWVHTGDLGYIDEEGNLFVKGRKKRLIIKRGMKIFPIEIEKVVKENNMIENCCVIGVPDPEFVEVPILYISLKEEYKHMTEEAIKEINDLCVSKLKAYSVPSNIKVIDKIPLTPMGKNSFKELRKIYDKENEKELVLSHEKNM